LETKIGDLKEFLIPYHARAYDENALYSFVDFRPNAQVGPIIEALLFASGEKRSNYKGLKMRTGNGKW
jgi:hypothetical protein